MSKFRISFLDSILYFLFIFSKAMYMYVLTARIL